MEGIWSKSYPIFPAKTHTHTAEVDFIQCDQGLSVLKLRTPTQPNLSRHGAKCQTVTAVVNMTTRPRRSFRPTIPNSFEQATPPTTTTAPLKCVMYSFGITAVRTEGRNGVNWSLGFFFFGLLI